MAQGASIEMTYAYGTFLTTRTGFIFTVFVQTRDQYGNQLTSDTENVVFESCKSVGGGCGEASTCSCGGDGGIENPDVTVERVYGLGPDLSQQYPGLYKFNYFLFSAGSFVHVVQHNLTYIKCYFDKGNETDSSKWSDPVDAANACTQYVRREAVLSQDSRRKMKKAITECPTQAVQATAVESTNHTKERESRNSTVMKKQDDRCTMIWKDAILAQAHRREGNGGVGPSFFSEEGAPLGKKSSHTVPSFVEQDRSRARFWIILAPIICAGIAFALVVIPFLVQLINQQLMSKRTVLEEPVAQLSPPPTRNHDLQPTSESN